MCLSNAYTLAVILTILVAVATALTAPSVDMPDTVLHEHHLSVHGAENHASNNLSDTCSDVLNGAAQTNAAVRVPETLHLSGNGRTQSSFVLRC